MSLFPLLGGWGPAHIRLFTPRLHLLKQLLKCFAVWFLVLRKSKKKGKICNEKNRTCMMMYMYMHLEASYERQS